MFVACQDGGSFDLLQSCLDALLLLYLIDNLQLELSFLFALIYSIVLANYVLFANNVLSFYVFYLNIALFYKFFE